MNVIIVILELVVLFFIIYFAVKMAIINAYKELKEEKKLERKDNVETFENVNAGIGKYLIISFGIIIVVILLLYLLFAG